jgi:RimJ/RimL family protein N-acetyltransferase
MYAFTGGAPETAAQIAVRYARWVAGAQTPGQTWVNLMVRERTSHAAVGYVQATINPDSTDIAWVIGTQWQRKGYATEATRALIEWLVRAFDVRLLRALIRADHVASHGVAERLGMARTTDEADGEQVWLGHVPRSV